MDYTRARQNMVEGQIRPNRVTDPVVTEAMETIPREIFVPKHLRGIAYADEDLDLGGGRWLMEPLTLARLLQEATIEPSDIALDIACGVGYSTALLSRMTNAVVAVESDPDLAARASAAIGDLGIDNAAVIVGDPTVGCPDQGTFDVIVINGAVEFVPEALLDQLADGGRLVTVIRQPGAPIGAASLYTRRGDAFGHRILFDAGVPLLPGFSRPLQFVF
jgi:protein-L-isoaspartate(D-aspartate) O-methyltransferase